jgi:hypothetical protein
MHDGAQDLLAWSAVGAACAASAGAILRDWLVLRRR